MLDYARQCVREALRDTHKAILVTSGPAGILAGEFCCEAIDLAVFLLVPLTSDHLFNLEHDCKVTLLAGTWEIKGRARVIQIDQLDGRPGLCSEPTAGWCALTRIDPDQVHIRREGGWGNQETFDF